MNFPRSFACLFVLLASAALSSGTTESFCLIGNHGRYGRAYRCVRKGATFVVEPIPGIMFGGWAEEVYYDTTNETLYVADGSARLFRVDLRAEDLEQVQANEMVFEAWFDACSKAPAWLHLPSGSDTACVLKYDGTNVSKVANADTVLFDHRHVFGIHIDGWKKLDDILAGKNVASNVKPSHSASRCIIRGRSRELAIYGIELVPRLRPGDIVCSSLCIVDYSGRLMIVDFDEQVDSITHDDFFLGRGFNNIYGGGNVSRQVPSGNWYLYRSGTENVRKIALRKDIVVHWAVGDTLLATDRKHLLEIDITSDTPREVVLAELPGEIEDVRGVYPVCATMQGEQE